MKKIALGIIGLSTCLTTIAHATMPPKLSTKMSDTITLQLGDGYASYDMQSAGQSPLDMSKTSVTYHDLQRNISLSQTISRDDLAKDLNVNMSASGGWGMFSASASASYFRHTENTAYTENVTYLGRVYANAKLNVSQLPHGVNALSAVGQNVYKQGIDAFTNRYGDTYIGQLPEGAMLLVNVQLHFNSALDKSKFDAALGAGYGSLVNASTEIQQAVSESHSKGSIEISAYQSGGDVSQLGNIFGEPVAGSYPVLTCSLDNLANCQKMIGNIITYAQVNFSKQIEQATSGSAPQGKQLSVVGQPTIMSFVTLGLQEAPPFPSTIIAARQQLATLYNQLQTNKTFVDHYLQALQTHFTPEGQTTLNNLQQALKWNASLMQQYGPVCYMLGQESSCQSAVDSIVSQSQKVDQSTIDYYKNTTYHEIAAGCYFYPNGTTSENSFFNWCNGQWINGKFTFTQTSTGLSENGDYIDPVSGHHMLSQGIFDRTAPNAFLGTVTFRDLTDGSQSGRLPVSVELVTNNL